MKFPVEMGDIGGKTFDQVFDTQPKIIEQIRSRWIESGCTGLFLDFFKYVTMRLQNPLDLEAHEDRCVAYVKTLEKTPSYLIKYQHVETRAPPRV